MRIGLFTDAYIPQIGGVSTSTALLRDELLRLGHDVQLVTARDPDLQERETNVERVPSLPFFSAKRAALPYHPLLNRRLAGLPFDVIHTQTEFGVGDYGRRLARRQGAAHVHTYHTLYEDWLNSQMKASQGGFLSRVNHGYVQYLTRRFCRTPQRIIVPTAKTRDILLTYRVRTPIEIVPTGLDLARFAAAREEAEKTGRLRRKLGLEEKDVLLLYLGRLSGEKQIERLFSLTQGWLQKQPRLHFLLVGEGPARAGLSERAAQSPVARQIHFTGPVPLADVAYYYAAADLFLSASQSETQGLTYMEALAAGLPILVRDDPCLEGVIDDQAALAFVDQASFDSQLQRLLAESPEEAAARSRLAQERASAYSVQAFARRVLAVYEEALGDLKSS